MAKLNVTLDQYGRGLIQCQVPVIGYFILRREGLGPRLSLEEPWYSRFRLIFRTVGAIGTLVVILDAFVFLTGIAGLGLVLLAISVSSEVVSLTDIGEHQVIGLTSAKAPVNTPEPSVKMKSNLDDE